MLKTLPEFPGPYIENKQLRLDNSFDKLFTVILGAIFFMIFYILNTLKGNI